VGSVKKKSMRQERDNAMDIGRWLLLSSMMGVGGSSSSESSLGERVQRYYILRIGEQRGWIQKKRRQTTDDEDDDDDDGRTIVSQFNLKRR
jgi:hypothetical protein